MNSRTKAQQKAHRDATHYCASARCLVCGEYGCEPAHYPVHRGMGSGKAGWNFGEWLPLCRACHDMLDGRNGVSAERTSDTERVREVVARLAPAFWRQAA